MSHRGRKPVKHEWKLKPHPSGRPVNSYNGGGLNIYRVPPDEPLTPGLRRKNRIAAIGFMAQISADEGC